MQQKEITVPPLSQIVSRLKRLTQAETKQLAEDSGVPYATLNKIRFGITKNPGVETVRKFLPRLPAALAEQE